MARIHLKFLDGLRGLAALYVVLFHLISTQEGGWSFSPLIEAALRWLRYGHFAVDVFIVLSGYCLMLPVARSVDGKIPGGVKRFFYRRGRRILPPVWAALAFSLAMILIVRTSGSHARADDGTAFSIANIATHALLIQNWFRAYSGSINLPMWTVAVESQIYVLFPLLLLPMWRRIGSLATVFAALIIGLLPRMLLPSNYNFDWSRPWYLGLFAMGMAAAIVHFGKSPSARRLPWGWMSAVLAIALVIMESVGGAERATSNLWAKDVLVGAMTACTLAFLAGVATEPAIHRHRFGAILARVAESPVAVTIGAFSYSMYLTHFPMMWVVKYIVRAIHLSPGLELAFRMTIAPAGIAAGSMLFYLVFERPFVSAVAPHIGDSGSPALTTDEANPPISSSVIAVTAASTL